MTDAFSIEVLRLVGSGLTSDFAGLGVVFYTDLNRLPFLQLAADAPVPELPVIGSHEIATQLLEVSRVQSCWHDGFHFVDPEKECLTHLAQFVSPPLPKAGDAVPALTGARLMTASLASLVEGILHVGVISNRRELLLFSGGKCVLAEKIV
ncbi:hypothetical protein [Xanthomonas phaseoli]|uniref:hypothetical protein n=1 Tax=Xanthomonas phaseoli TaxID=1985254 RepID=UPI0009B62C68|nr:hypothetical protein [Xanthomonas phaseoli]